MKKVFGIKVFGNNVDAQTGCAHYRSPLDIIAIKFKCCGKWFPCFECHAESSEHPAQIWSADDFETRAVLCGKCGYQLTINEYFKSNFVCPDCSGKFNPGCANHYRLYFDI